MQLSELIFESKGYIDYTPLKILPFSISPVVVVEGGGFLVYSYLTPYRFYPLIFKVLLYEAESPVLNQIAQNGRKSY